VSYDIDQQLDALGDPTRRAVLRLLRDGPRSVTELAGHFPVSRPAISQHLRVLSDAGFVSATPDGTRRVYACRPEAFDSLRAYIDDFWTAALGNFKQRAEARRSRKRRAS
jgi:DNA-binding transcriptional ArsR family regulator